MFRSLLFIPGNNPSMIQNADIFMADGIIFDLEDAVSISEKNNARNLIKHYLANSSVLPKQVVLRVNSFGSEWFIKDLEILKTKKVNYLLVPKLDYESLNTISSFLSDYEEKEKLEETKIIALVETAKGITEMSLFAQNKRLIGILLGAEDLTNDLEIKRTETSLEIFYARSQVIYFCRANNLIAIDTPYTDINNIDGLKTDCKYAYGLGMKAKAAIHPNQLEIINDIFSPTKEEIEWAKAIIKLSEKNPEKGAFQYRGKMIDKPIIERAKKIIQKAEIFNLL